MSMYKIQKNPFDGSENIILRTSDNCFIPRSFDNTDYQKFIQDVRTGAVVEGSTVGVTTDYKEARKTEYPPLEDQLDKIYHSGIDAWKADIKVIKDKYPKTQVGVTTVGTLPSWIQTDVDERRKTDYLTAVERLKEPRLKLGTPYTERVYNPEELKYEESIKYRNVPSLSDPRVIRDEAERDAAQAVIDGTPQSIIDSINT